MDKIQKYRYLKELKQLKREKLLREARDDFFSYVNYEYRTSIRVPGNI